MLVLFLFWHGYGKPIPSLEVCPKFARVFLTWGTMAFIMTLSPSLISRTLSHPTIQ
jgi:hypothetical protein